LIATHVQPLAEKRNAKPVEEKMVRRDLSIHHADQLQHHAEHQEKEKNGARQKKSLTIL